MHPPSRLVARDLSVAVVTATSWWADRHGLCGNGATGVGLGIATGVLTALVGFLLHEWGHLAGSLLTASRVHYPSRLLAPLLFHFDTRENDRRQFLAMSYGGYVASAIGIAGIAWTVPLDAWSGRVALILAGIGTLVTLVAEVPTTVRVARGATLPDGFAFRPPA